MTFRTFDIERDLASQGFEGGYDVLIADNVLHVTNCLVKTLLNVREALKMGGKLLLHEFLTPSGWTTGFIFGVFPGWWLGAEDDRPLSPNITLAAWDSLLKKTGFSGVDMVFMDLGDNISHQLGWIVSTATPDSPSLNPQPQKTCRLSIIINQASAAQATFAEALLLHSTQITGMERRIMSLEAACAGDLEESPDHLTILLVDIGESFLESLTAATWDQLKTCIKASRHLLWISEGGGRNAVPDHGMLDGLTRTLRSEYYELHLVTLALEANRDKKTQVPHVIQVIQEMLDAPPGQPYEQEYCEIDGYLHTRRLVESRYLKTTMDDKLTPYEFKPVSLADGVPIAVSTNPQDRGLGPHYTRLTALPPETIESNALDINVKAVFFQSRDGLFTLGQDKDASVGSYYAGVIHHAGPECPLKPGDHVVAFGPAAFRSHIRVSSNAAIKMPAGLSFSEGCQTVPSMVAAHHALVEIGRVRSNDSVLIYDGASLNGQASLQLLTELGVKDIWATASSEEDSTWITNNYDIAPKRVLPSSGLVSHPMLFSELKQKFDMVVLGSSDTNTTWLMDCVRSGGRCILVWPGTSGPRSLAEIYRVPDSVSLTTIHLGSLLQMSCHISPRSLEYPAESTCKFSLQNPRYAAHQFQASQLSEVSNYLRSPAHGESVVITFDACEVVDVLK
ncbi:hypothetical protein F4779DRAFT_116453 [Xylariaceae sp. FL0662B]|nr:hypothetical protein F4779DRAFT_116453 [Xylariaceae sp. FL0662B]